MYNIIPLILILISLSIIIIITARKFPVLANLDVENMPVEKEARFKEQIISNRLKRTYVKWRFRALKLLRPLGGAINIFLKWIMGKLHELRDKYKKEISFSKEETRKKTEQLFAEVEDCRKKGETERAEKILVKIIGMDNKNIKAFKELGKIYFENKNYSEAKQTFEYVLRIKEDDEEVYDNLARIARESGDLEEARNDYLKSLNINTEQAQTYFELASVYEAMGNAEEAVLNMGKALAIEPNNPRYLDMMLQMSIIKKDKKGALAVYDKLAEVNSENQKLVEFKKQIDEI